GSSSPKTVTVSTAGGAAKKPTAAPRAKKPTGTTAAKTTTAGAPITTTGAPATPPAPVLHLTTFRSPSGNIGCELVTAFARCDIANREWKPPPKPAGCPLDYGQGLEVGRSGPGRLVCAGDTALNPQARAL